MVDIKKLASSLCRAMPPATFRTAFLCWSGGLATVIATILTGGWFLAAQEWNDDMDKVLFCAGLLAYLWKYVALTWFRALNLEKATPISVADDFLSFLQGAGRFTNAMCAVVIDCAFQTVATLCEILSGSALAVIIFRASTLLFWITGNCIFRWLPQSKSATSEESESATSEESESASELSRFAGGIAVSVLGSIVYAASLVALHWHDNDDLRTDASRFHSSNQKDLLAWHHAPLAGFTWSVMLTLGTMTLQAQFLAHHPSWIGKILVWRVIVGLLGIALSRAFIAGELLACCTILKATLTIMYGVSCYLLSKHFEAFLFARGARFALVEIGVADSGASTLIYSLVHTAAFDDVPNALNQAGAAWHALFVFGILLHVVAVGMVFVRWR